MSRPPWTFSTPPSLGTAALKWFRCLWWLFYQNYFFYLSQKWVILYLNKVVLSSFTSGLAKLQVKHLQKFSRLMEMIFCQGPRFFRGLRFLFYISPSLPPPPSSLSEPKIKNRIVARKGVEILIIFVFDELISLMKSCTCAQEMYNKTTIIYFWRVLKGTKFPSSSFSLLPVENIYIGYVHLYWKKIRQISKWMQLVN